MFTGLAMNQRPQNRMGYFAMLTEAEQLHSVLKLAQSGNSDHGIASITGLHVEQVRRMLGQRSQCEACDE
jgi:hypothetical protein